MVMVDAISRLVPGVLNNEVSAETESFHNNLLEYPQYSRPEEWHGKKVPLILMSGNHRKIMEWRLEQSKQRTEARRPDLYHKYMQKERLIKRLSKEKRNNIHMMESLSRGKGEILYEKGKNILIYDRKSKVCVVTAENAEAGEVLLKYVPEETKLFTTSQVFMNDLLCKAFDCRILHECYQVCALQREALPVKHKDIRLLTVDALPYVSEHYSPEEREYLKERILAKAMYGAYMEERLVGFVGEHAEGSLGILYVEESVRGRGIGSSLEAFMVNRQREWGYIPYGHVIVGNENSKKLQESLGLYFASDNIWWLEK